MGDNGEECNNEWESSHEDVHLRYSARNGETTGNRPEGGLHEATSCHALDPRSPLGGSQQIGRGAIRLRCSPCSDGAIRTSATDSVILGSNNIEQCRIHVTPARHALDGKRLQRKKRNKGEVLDASAAETCGLSGDQTIEAHPRLGPWIDGSRSCEQPDSLADSLGAFLQPILRLETSCAPSHTLHRGSHPRGAPK